jgi:hypothetical protein
LNYILSSSDELGLVAIYIQPTVKVEKAQPGPGVVVSSTSGTVPGHITAVNTGEVCFAGGGEQWLSLAHCPLKYLQNISE